MKEARENKAQKKLDKQVVHIELYVCVHIYMYIYIYI